MKQLRFLREGAILLILILLDQAVKYAVRTQIPLFGRAAFLPGVLEFTYVKNTGAAFSIFSGQRVFLILISALIAAAVGYALFSGAIRGAFGRISFSVLLAGAIGNLLDRVCLGFVVDMFRVLPFEFAVFNVADICVVLGGACAAAYMLLLHEPGQSGKKGTP